MLPIVFHSVETYQCFFFVCLFECFFVLFCFCFVFLFLLKSDIVTWVETAKYFVNWTHVHFLLDEILYRFVWNERFGPGSYCKCCRGIEKYPEKGFFSCRDSLVSSQAAAVLSRNAFFPIPGRCAWRDQTAVCARRVRIDTCACLTFSSSCVYVI